MKLWKVLKPILVLGVVAGLGYAGYRTQEHWRPWVTRLIEQPVTEQEESHESPVPDLESEFLEISDQARRNLGLSVERVAATEYWRTIQVPGVIVDRPGSTDRGVTAPVSGSYTISAQALTNAGHWITYVYDATNATWWIKGGDNT